MPVDDLGHRVPRTRPVHRVVSLVPSLTESVASVRPDVLVGATAWCTHPADLDVVRVRGPKNPDVRAIFALAPDLVLANKEENRRADVESLRSAGVPVWVTDIESVEQAFTSLRRLFDQGLGWTVPAWVAEAEQAWAAPTPAPRRNVVMPIWRDPWIVVGEPTFTGDLLSRLGLVNRFPDQGRYPRVGLDEILAATPEIVILADEPYPFSADDGPECFPGIRVIRPEGRLLTWYGPSLVAARARLEPIIG